MGSPLEEKLRKRIEPALYKCRVIPQARKAQECAVRAIRERGHASVVFIASSLPMWRAQKLFDLLRADRSTKGRALSLQ